MDIVRAFTHPFDDKDWLKKTAIGGVVMLIPVVDFIGVGFGFRHLRDLLDGKETPLPEWDDWGGDFKLGLYPALASLIYMIPMWLLSWSPFLRVVYGLVLSVFLLTFYLRYARDPQFRVFFQFKEAYAFIRANLSEYAVAWLVSLVVAIPISAASGASGWLLAIIVALTAFLAMLISFHLLAQVQHKADGTTLGSTQ